MNEGDMWWWRLQVLAINATLVEEMEWMKSVAGFDGDCTEL